MRIWTGLDSIAPPFPASSVAIGVFDGVHVGHQALVRAALEDARAHQRTCAVFTFDRHPAEVIAPQRAPEYLSTPEQRTALLEALGVEDLVVARFDEALRQTPPEAFLRDILVGLLGARTIVVGRDFRFGKDHAGGIDLLRDRQADLGYTLTAISPVTVDGASVSSSRIRHLLRDGSVEAAAEMLARPYALVGTVVEGDRLGRRLGFPTANLHLAVRQVVPADGVYAGRAAWPGGKRACAISIGVRPTVDGRRRVIEAYLLGFDGDLYGQRLEVSFGSRLREQRRYETLDALVAQMRLDVEQTARLANEPAPATEDGSA